MTLDEAIERTVQLIEQVNAWIRSNGTNAERLHASELLLSHHLELERLRASAPHTLQSIPREGE